MVTTQVVHIYSSLNSSPHTDQSGDNPGFSEQFQKSLPCNQYVIVNFACEVLTFGVFFLNQGPQGRSGLPGLPGADGPPVGVFTTSAGTCDA